jgi:NAD(P)-dependent dehydrogenase (short-subunit alcohol dehydrogenase family)
VSADQTSKPSGTPAALVLGASGDIGAAVAMRLATDGYDILLAGRSHDRLRDVAADAEKVSGRRAWTLAKDLREPGAADVLIDQTVDAAGRLDVLACCAGEFKRGDLLALSAADWQDGFATMFFGAVNTVRAAWPHLKKTRGRIVMISGVFAYKPPAGGALPGALAAAVLNFTKSSAELGLRDGISVNCVLPGPIAGRRLDENLAGLMKERGLSHTDALRAYAQRLGIERIGTPEDVADAVAFLASPTADFMRGASLVVDGGSLRML